MERKRKIETPWGFTYEWELISWEKGNELIKEFDGKELTSYKVLYPNFCSETVPYILNDGRVLILNPADAYLIESLKGYMANIEQAQMFIRKYISTTYPQKRIKYLLGGDKIYYYLLDKVEGEVIRNLYTPLDKSVYPYASGSEIYRTLENEILEYTGSYYNLYISETDFQLYHEKKKLVSERLSERKKISIRPGKQVDFGYTNSNMCGRNPYGERFPEKVEELCAKLSELLHMPSSVFTGHESSLAKIERVFYRNVITDEFSDQLFLPMLAYLGKVFLVTYKGKWEMRYDEIFDSWTPDIRVREGWKEMYWPLLEIFDCTERMWSPLRAVVRHSPKAI